MSERTVIRKTDIQRQDAHAAIDSVFNAADITRLTGEVTLTFVFNLGGVRDRNLQFKVHEFSKAERFMKALSPIDKFQQEKP